MNRKISFAQNFWRTLLAIPLVLVIFAIVAILIITTSLRELADHFKEKAKC